ncbi:folate-binding protein YgfZ [Oculatella sp. LEGE 06141]|uniref:CAF17-like 4Fe-4S cluster assembly/insertion protein YgfZ n=1 Tax=Oculatella sp. LEGE 06141 TaxID=1828648 RepID=UPI001881408C|nr:folate-binding protein YgfZ [Oculatella sp. LEGE 06141]MBE9177407.1 folate-binding protein YgfZ [Oculatella sp. LEGE 06141]
MTQTLRDTQQACGAHFSAASLDEPTASAPISFGNDEAALRAAKETVALCDRTHWGRIQVKGADRIRFLHNQTTNNFTRLQPGQGCDTVFVTSTGRTIDLVSAYILEDSVLLFTSPGYSKRLLEWMDRFIFFADQVELSDLTDQTAAFSLVGPSSRALLEQLGAGDGLANSSSHVLTHLDGIEVRIAVGSGLAIAGYTLMTDMHHAADLWQRLFTAGATPLGETAWEQLRIRQGRPRPEHELTEDFNPLEAGLWQTIALDKGCYIGQETIARLHTYRGVKQQLFGVELSKPAEVGSLVTAGDEKIGKLTSCIQTEQGSIGLAYIRSKAAQPGLAVQVAGEPGELVELPFVTHTYPSA